MSPSIMTSGTETTRAISGAVAGLLYGCVLAFLSFGAIGFGHGTLIPLLLSSAPLGVFYLLADTDAGRGMALSAMLFGAPFAWAVLGWLVARPGHRMGLAAGLLVLHYVSGLALVVATGDTPRDIAGKIPDFFMMWAPVYLVGQLALWWLISRGHRLR
jgi:hypothetical protein